MNEERSKGEKVFIGLLIGISAAVTVVAAILGALVWRHVNPLPKASLAGAHGKAIIRIKFLMPTPDDYTTTPFIITGEYVPSDITQAEVESDTVRWLCSGYAIYTGLLEKSQGAIGGTWPEEAYYLAGVSEAYERDWGITDRATTIEKVENLIVNGHRKEYRLVAREMYERGWLQFSREELREELKLYSSKERNQLMATYEAYHVGGLTAIDAWDYSRMLQVLGDAYQMGYINIEECLSQSLIIGERIQREYGSWEAFGTSYLYGYNYWRKISLDSMEHMDQERWDIFETLQAEADGPYSVPFDMELQDTWGGQSAAAKIPPEVLEGYCTVYNEIKDQSVKVKIPEHFQYLAAYSEEAPFLLLVEDGTYRTVAVSYRLLDEDIDAEGRAEEIATNEPRYNMNLRKNRSIQAGEREISYLYYSYSEDAYGMVNQVSFQIWMPVEGKGTLVCEATESILQEDLKYVGNAQLVEMLFSNVE